MKTRQSLTQTVNKYLEYLSTKCGYFYDGKPLDWQLTSCSHGCIFKVFWLNSFYLYVMKHSILQALIENFSLPDELRMICKRYLPSCNMTTKTDEHSTGLLVPLLRIHCDLSKVVYQHPRVVCGCIVYFQFVSS